MPRRVDPLVVEDADRNTLLDIVSGRAAVGADIVKRAQAILRMNEGVQLKSIASELDMRPNTITDIRNRYLNRGISSLVDHERSGRPVETSMKEVEKSLDKIIQEARENGVVVPSVKELSKTLKAPEAKIRDYLKQKDIIQTRKRTWDFRTSDGFVAHFIDVVGVYISPKQQILIVQTSSDVLESASTHEGSLTVRNRSLALRIEESADADGGIELAKALEVFNSMPSDQELNHSGNGAVYVQSVIEAFPVTPGIEYHIFACGDPIIETDRTMIRGAYLHNEETLEGWNAQVESIINVLYQNGDSAETIIGICNGIKKYLRRSRQVPDTFEWRKIKEVKQDETIKVTDTVSNAQPTYKPGDVVSTNMVMGDDGQWITITVTGHCPITQAEFDTSSKEAYLLSFHQVEQSIIAVTHEASRSLSEKYLNVIGKKKTENENEPRIVKLQSETGILQVISPAQVADGLKNTEYLWGLSLVDYLEQGMIEYSGRVTNRLLNTLLHRDERFEEIKVRTMTDRVEAAGLAYLESENAWATNVLKEHGWDSETLQPLNGTDTLKYTGPVYELTEDQKATRLKCIEQINSKRSEDARIPEDAENVWDVEPDPCMVVKVSLDGVGAKRQKDTRPKEVKDKTPDYIHDENDGPADFTRAPDPKSRPKVETAVAHIEVDGKKYLFVGKNMFMACKFVLAFLLSNNLLIDRHLLFFSDGGIDIRKCVNSIFAFCPHVVVLDWFHLRKHCYECMSMALLSGKANRALQYEGRRRLFHILWVGNVDGAIAYLNSLGPDKVPSAKRKYLDNLIEYLRKNKDRHVIACYAMRAKLGLRISSNPVEKANDLIVSSRQKGDCMSWSRSGSWGLAAITCMYINHEAENIHLHHTALHEMYTDYGKIFNLKTKRYKKVA